MTGSVDTFNPFPGLRPFRQEDKPVFFGRERETLELVLRLNERRFLAAIGPSGSGKSSLIYAGLLPELYGGAMVQAGAHWRVAEFRPAGNPVGELARALIRAELYSADAEELLSANLRRSGLGLVDAVRHAQLPTGTNLLVLVDQFEELFRFSRKNAADLEAATAFVDLLLEAIRQTALPIFVVITMRSDFIGDCAQFPGLPEAVNSSQYLIPRLTRDQWRAAIEGPVQVGGGRIAPRLVQRLLADVADSPDQLPVLQHALMRTWDFWERTRHGDEPLDLRHYENQSVGTMTHALSRHADEVFQELPDDPARRRAERLFKTLTELGEGQRGIRRPARVAELAQILAGNADEVAALVEPFRRPGRTFLMPPADRELTADTVLDISHESLMRVWERLRTWTEEEARSVRIYRRLAETARLWKSQREGLYRDPALSLAVDWRTRNQPNAAWAARHGEGFEDALEFLETSRLAQEEEVRSAEAARQKELDQAHALAEEQRGRANAEWAAARRLRLFLAGLAVLLLVIAVLAGSNWRAKRIALSRQWTAVAANYFEEEPELSISLALAALESWHTPSAEFALRQAVSRSRVRSAWTLPESRGNARIARVSPDGLRLVTAAGQEVQLRQRASRDADVFGDAKTLLHPDPITDLAFSASGRWLAVATRGTSTRVTIWDTSTGQIARQSDFAHADRIRTVRFAADEERVVTASQDPRLGMLVWSWKQGTPQLPFAPGGVLTELGAVNEVAVHPTLPFAASAGVDHVLRLWNLTNGTWSSHGDSRASRPLRCVAFSPDGTHLVTAGVGETWVFDFVPPEAGSLPPLRLRKPWNQTNRVQRVEFSPDGRSILSLAEDGLARICDLEGSPIRGEIGRVMGATPTILSAHFSADGDWILAAMGDSRARVWSAREDGEPVATFSRHSAQVEDVAWVDGAGAGSVVTLCSNRTTRLWEMPTGRASRVPTLHEIQSVSLTADGSLGLAVAPGPGTSDAVVFRTADGTRDPAWPDLGRTQLAALGPDGQRIATLARSNEVAVWTRNAPTPLRLSVDQEPRHLVLNASSSRLAALTAEAVLLWELTGVPSNSSARVIPLPPDLRASLLRFAVDERSLVVFGEANRAVRIGGTPLEVTPLQLQGLNDEPAALAVGPRGGPGEAGGGRLLAGFIRGKLRTWDDPLLATQRVSSAMIGPGHTLAISAVGWSTDGRWALSGATDQTARVWDLSRMAAISSLGGHRGYVYAVALDASANQLTTVGSEGTVRRYSVPETLPYAALVELARRRVPDAASQSSRLAALLADRPATE